MRTRAVIVALLVSVSCARAPEPRTFELVGQVLGVDLEKREVLLKHQDVVGFMPGMTMPFKVRDDAVLKSATPGDLVRATLVVEEADAYLSAITRTGHAPIETPAPAPAITSSDLLEPGSVVSDEGLVDQDGRPNPLSSLRGHRVALTFIYTRCPLPDSCPLMDRQFLAVQNALASNPALADVRLVTVTFDPEFDTPAVLAAHARRLGADPRRWSFVTGDAAAVAAFARGFGVVTERQDAEPAVITHNLRTALLDPEGRLIKVTSGNQWTPADLVADLTSTSAPAH